MKWQFGHCRSRINTKRDDEKGQDESLNQVNKVDEKVRSLPDDEGNYDLEMNGDDGIVPDLPLTDLAESRNGHNGQLETLEGLQVLIFLLSVLRFVWGWDGEGGRGGQTGAEDPRSLGPAPGARGPLTGGEEEDQEGGEKQTAVHEGSL